MTSRGFVVCNARPSAKESVMMTRPAPMRRNLFVTLFAIVSALSVFACSSRQVDDTSTAAVTEELTGPVTVSISVPNPLSPVAPVLVGADGTTVNSNSTVVSGTVVAMGPTGFSAGSNAVLNDAWSRGRANLANSVQLRGTLHAASALTGIGDVIQARDSNPLLDPPSTLSWIVTYPTGAAPDVTVPGSGTMSIGPGHYGTVTINSAATLSLSAGTYYLTSLSMSPRAKVTMTPGNGPVIIYVSTSIALGGTFYSSTPDGGAGPAPDLFIGYSRDGQQLIEVMIQPVPPRDGIVFHVMPARQKIIDIAKRKAKP